MNREILHMISPPAIVATRDLESLARDIKCEHASCEASLGQGAQHARQAGELLRQAKAKCNHGTWLAWLAEHVGIQPQLAQRYMRIASRWKELGDQAPELSTREAIKLLAESREHEENHPNASRVTHLEPDAKRSFYTLSREQLLDHLRQWPNMLERCVYMMDARGRSVQSVADDTGCTVEKIESILSPVPPQRNLARFGFSSEWLANYTPFVMHCMHHHLWLLCYHVAGDARGEGWADAAGILEAQSKRHKRAAEKWSPGLYRWESMADEQNEWGTFFTLSFCARNDARSATGEFEAPSDEVLVEHNDFRPLFAFLDAQERDKEKKARG